MLSFGIGSIMVFIHLIGVSGFGLILDNRQFSTDRLTRILRRLHVAFRASCLIQLDTASFLAVSWQLAALPQLKSNSTSYETLMVSWSSAVSAVIALGTLMIIWEDMTRRWYQLAVTFLYVILYIPITAVTSKQIIRGNFPLDDCIPYLKSRLPYIRAGFAVNCTFFGGGTLVFLAAFIFLYQKGKKKWRLQRICVVFVYQLGHATIFVMMRHYFVCQNELEKAVGYKLAEMQWSFGQSVALLIWLPVIAEFISVLWRKFLKYPCLLGIGA